MAEARARTASESDGRSIVRQRARGGDWRGRSSGEQREHSSGQFKSFLRSPLLPPELFDRRSIAEAGYTLAYSKVDYTAGGSQPLSGGQHSSRHGASLPKRIASAVHRQHCTEMHRTQRDEMMTLRAIYACGRLEG